MRGALGRQLGSGKLRSRCAGLLALRGMRSLDRCGFRIGRSRMWRMLLPVGFGRRDEGLLWQRRRDGSAFPAASSATTPPARPLLLGAIITGCRGRRKGVFVRLLAYPIANLFRAWFLWCAQRRPFRSHFPGAEVRGGMRFAGSFGRRNGQLHAQSREGVRCLLLPIATAEALRSDRVPLHGLVVSRGFLFNRSELPRHHGVAGTLEKFRKLCRRVGTVLRFADSRLNLAPVGHGGAL